MKMEDRKKLVDTVCGVHEHLRKSLFFSKDVERVWNEHLSDTSLRETYSSAMKALATKHWTKDNECRIKWSYETCFCYFFDGGLQQSLQRQKKMEYFHSNQKQSISDQPFLPNTYCNLDRKLKLLDVGSCYNPFSEYDIFSCIPIDLTPADKDVLQYDFSAAQIKKQSGVEDNADLFVEKTYDVVVFSLVLEYLPDPGQRVIFCQKAWKLLIEHGLLIIITPDSKSVNYNAPMMKSWKSALEKIGFFRFKYTKLTHLHCMAFRKLTEASAEVSDSKLLSSLMYIPQDHKVYKENEKTSERTSAENETIVNGFLCLPDFELL